MADVAIARQHRLITEWSTPSPVLAKVLKMVSDEPEHSILRLELEAALHSFQARLCYEQIARLKRAEQDRARRKQTSKNAHSQQEDQ